MVRWQILASVAISLMLAGSARAQSYSLAEASQAGTCYRIELTMSLTGKLKVLVDEQEKTLQESASATHQYFERILETGTDGIPTKSGRLYKEAQVCIIVDSNKVRRSLRPEHFFLAAHRQRDGLLAWSPESPLTQEEADVTDHFDTLTVAGLLPADKQSVGSTWKISNAVVQALCHVPALSEQNVTCKLDDVKDDIAIFSVSGEAAGIDLGASVKTTVAATGRFDLKEQRLVALQWKQTDERGQGPVSPASSFEVTVKLTRTPVETVNELSDIAVVPLQTAPQSDLEFKDAKGRFQMQYARDWWLVGKTDEHTVFRLLDRGEFVAQLSVAPWQKAQAGKHLSADEIKSIVANSPGWAQETLLKDEEVKLPTGQWAYLVAGAGDLGQDRAVQYFYFVAGPEGDQAMLTFTMTPTQAQKLGSRDLELVQRFLLPGARREAQVKPAQ
jgi:hypothetical protein